MREGTVGFRHPVHVFPLLDSVPPVIRRVEQFCRKPLRHRLFIALAGRSDQPADSQRLPADRANLNRHLIGGAADAPRTDFDGRHHVLQRLLEHGERALLGLGLDHAERAINNAFGDRLLPGVHYRVHELRNDDVSEFRVRKHFTFFSGMAARHLICSRLFRTFGAVFRTALLTVLDALRIEDAAENVITHAGQILDTAAADHHHRMFLKVVAFARNVTDHLKPVGEAYLGDLAQRRVRLLWRRGVDTRAHAALLRRLLQRRHLLARLLYDARTCDQLVDRRHISLHLLTFTRHRNGSAKFPWDPWRSRTSRLSRKPPAQSEIAPTAHR